MQTLTEGATVAATKMKTLGEAPNEKLSFAEAVTLAAESFAGEAARAGFKNEEEMQAYAKGLRKCGN